MVQFSLRFEKWSLIYFYIILFSFLFLISDSNPTLISRITFSILTPIIAILDIKASQLLAKNHGHSVREVVRIFSSVFSILTIFGFYLRFIHSLNADGNSTDEISRIFFTITSGEMNVIAGLEIAFGIFIMLITTDCINMILCYITNSRIYLKKELISTYIFFGLYKISQKNEQTEHQTSSFMFLFSPTKLLTVLVMKCLCSATATYAAVNLILLICYPKIAKNIHITPAESCFIVCLLGFYTILSAFLDSQSPDLISNFLKFSKNFFSRYRQRA